MLPITLDAIEIITDTGNGIPVAGPDSQIGLASDGHIAVITGRPGLTGVGKIITGDTARTVWTERILAKNANAYLPGSYCDFSRAGAFQDSSTMEFSIVATGVFIAKCELLGIQLGRRRVIHYKVRSTDGITFHFKRWFQGVIDNQPLNALTQNIRCISADKDIFKSLPKKPVNSSTFEDAPQDSLEKMIPIAIGRVSHSTLVSVAKSGKKVVLNKIDDIEYTIAAVIDGTAASLRLLTRGLIFAPDDDRLVGKYVSVFAGGKPQNLRIKSNDETVVAVSTTQYTTRVYTDDPVDLTVAMVVWDQTTSGDGIQGVWYAEVVDFEPVLIASTKPIYSTRMNQQGRPILSVYKSDRNVFDDVSEMNISTSLSDIQGTGFPGYSVLARSADADGSLISYFNIYPSDIVVDELDGWESHDVPAVGTSVLSVLGSREIGTGFTLFDLAAVDVTATVGFLVYLPKDDVLKQFSELYVLFDLQHKHGGGAGSTLMKVTIHALDFYGRTSDMIVDGYTVFNGALGGTFTDLNLLPRAYYEGATGSNADYFTHKAGLNIASLLEDSKKAKAFNALRIQISTVQAPPFAYTVQLNQIGIVGKRSIGVSSETIYGGLIGETFGTTWDGRKTPGDAITNPVDALEHGIRNKDTSELGWRPGASYVVGATVRGTTDNGHIFVCTVAGTSHASSEPTWTDTSGAVYADGTVTWKELREIPIDTATFDIASAQLADTVVGRTLVDPKDSIDYYEEMMEQFFLIGLIGADGKVKVKSWLDNRTPLIDFHTGSDPSGKILEKSLSNMTLTEMRDVANDFLIKYDHNPGSGKFNKQIFVTNVDKPAFPAETETVTPSQNLGAFTVDFVYPVDGQFQIVVEPTVTIPYGTFGYASLSGNSDGLSFPFTEIKENEVSFFRFLTLAVSPTISSGTGSSSGTLLWNSNPKLAWKEYVGGIEDYQTAKDLWDAAHESYTVCKAVQKLPKEMGECYWFIDPKAQDAAGNYIWSVDGTAATLDMDVGDEHAAVFYLRKLIAWTSKQKKRIQFEVEASLENDDLEIGDCVSFTDSKLTRGDMLLGWIEERTPLAATKKLPSRFRFGLMLDPT